MFMLIFLLASLCKHKGATLGIISDNTTNLNPKVEAVKETPYWLTKWTSDDVI